MSQRPTEQLQPGRSGRCPARCQVAYAPRQRSQLPTEQLQPAWKDAECRIRPLVLLTQNRRDEALAVLGTVPGPPNDHLLETERSPRPKPRSPVPAPDSSPSAQFPVIYANLQRPSILWPACLG